MLIIFGIGIFGSSLSTVECRFHMTIIMQLGFIYISQSNCLVTVEIEMGSVPVSETCRHRRGLSERWR
jgi:hypothetical protein